MRAELKHIQSNEHLVWDDCLASSLDEPWDSFGWFTVEIGPDDGMDSGEFFQVLIVTPAALSHVKTGKEGHRYVVVPSFEADVILGTLKMHVAAITGCSWAAIIEQLRKSMWWERGDDMGTAGGGTGFPGSPAKTCHTSDREKHSLTLSPTMRRLLVHCETFCTADCCRGAAFDLSRHTIRRWLESERIDRKAELSKEFSDVDARLLGLRGMLILKVRHLGSEWKSDDFRDFWSRLARAFAAAAM